MGSLQATSHAGRGRQINIAIPIHTMQYSSRGHRIAGRMAFKRLPEVIIPPLLVGEDGDCFPEIQVEVRYYDWRSRAVPEPSNPWSNRFCYCFARMFKNFNFATFQTYQNSKELNFAPNIGRLGCFGQRKHSKQQNVNKIKMLVHLKARDLLNRID